MARHEAGLLAPIARYYSDKLRERGATAQGVDWNSPESQELRFVQLARLLPSEEPFSVCDLGCGYGGLVDYLERCALEYSYVGLDISADMVRAAAALHAGNVRARFELVRDEAPQSQYCLASGIFNVKLDAEAASWHTHVLNTLDTMHDIGTRGFAFNCLTSYSDPDRMRSYLYYANACELFDHCKRRYSSHVALLHDYGLYEFTILVRKDR